MAELVAVILWSDGNELSQNALRDLTSTLHAAVKPKKKKGQPKVRFLPGWFGKCSVTYVAKI